MDVVVGAKNLQPVFGVADTTNPRPSGIPPAPHLRGRRGFNDTLSSLTLAKYTLIHTKALDKLNPLWYHGKLS